VKPAIGRRHDEIALLGDDFDRMAEQMERLVTAQRNLLGDVSQELRSPLARLIVALSLLKQAQSDEAPEYQTRIGIEADPRSSVAKFPYLYSTPKFSNRNA
jgi:two-component system, OmpR family, sensor kinase